MAKEAILKIREAEEKSNDKIKAATERAKEIIKSSEVDGNEKAKTIIKEATSQKNQAIETAKHEALTESEPMINEGKALVDKILNPDNEMFNKAVNLVMERIVSVNGDS